MSFQTGRMLRDLRAHGRIPMSPIRCERRDTVLDTFCDYRFRCVGLCNDKYDLRDLSQFEVFDSATRRSCARGELDHRCYAYLWSIRLKKNTLYKVGITGNLHRRLSAFQSSVPPVFRVKAEAILIFDSPSWAEVCEWSVLASHVDLWVGGEWLKEPRRVSAEVGHVR
jgi:hypothetical protein